MAERRCSEGDTVIASDTLNRHYESAMDNIRRFLFPSAQRARPDYHLVGAAPNLSGCSTLTVIVLDDAEFHKKFPEHDLETTRGVYASSEEKIYLHEGRYCIKTIIHETLHSCSITSQEPLLLHLYRPFFEGLTEYYTGYILYKMYHTCYSNCWKAVENLHCKMTYAESAKLWGSFVHFLPLRLTTNLYFYTGSGNFNSKMSDLVSAVRDLGYDQFENPVGEGSLRFRFAIQCEKCFREDWQTFNSSNTMWCDYNNIVTEDCPV